MTDGTSPQIVERPYHIVNNTLNMKARLRDILNQAFDQTNNISSIIDHVSKSLISEEIDTFTCMLLSESYNYLSPPKRVMTTLPDALVQAYDEKKYEQHDIMFEYAVNNQQTILYSTLLESLKFRSNNYPSKTINREISLLYQAFGYHDFYLIPIARNGTVALFSLSLRDTGGDTLLPHVQG